MKTVHHRLLPATPGAQLELVSLHYGVPGAGPKVAIQASLHADEIAPMLVAHHLRTRFAQAEAEGRVTGEIVLVPAANPIGLAQRFLHGPQGRFDLETGQNFNRYYPNLLEGAVERVQGKLGGDAQLNARAVRAALADAASALPARGALDSLRRTLIGLAIDADIVLDLHTDSQAVLHLYTTPQGWPRTEPLARLLGVRAALLATASGDDPFDEACSMIWPRLAERFGPATPLPEAGCVAVTIELRGEADVDHALAARDAEAIVQYLVTQGVVSGPMPELPAALCEPTPLAGSIPVYAPHGGVVAWGRHPGDVVTQGEALAEVIDPVTGQASTVAAPVDGVFYAREVRRFVVAGGHLCKIAGREAVRTGKLLSA